MDSSTTEDVRKLLDQRASWKDAQPEARTDSFLQNYLDLKSVKDYLELGWHVKNKASDTLSYCLQYSTNLLTSICFTVIDFGLGTKAPSTPTETTNKKRGRNSDNDKTAALQEWYNDHWDNPYPKLAEKEQLSIQSGLSIRQVSDWFCNERKNQGGARKRKNAPLFDSSSSDFDGLSSPSQWEGIINLQGDSASSLDYALEYNTQLDMGMEQLKHTESYYLDAFHNNEPFGDEYLPTLETWN
ncbi:irx-related [Planoprotostelium fungivorum]|uniref:Irx-related n=1 Tax=Planoprotostelium fungivorum TaxID=1890364 RepID=A0A2P6N2N4_9EUKA|nr:irx-related [Planoprotostelium fungivorum]